MLLWTFKILWETLTPNPLPLPQPIILKKTTEQNPPPPSHHQGFVHLGALVGSSDFVQSKVRSRVGKVCDLLDKLPALRIHIPSLSFCELAFHFPKSTIYSIPVICPLHA